MISSDNNAPTPGFHLGNPSHPLNELTLQSLQLLLDEPPDNLLQDGRDAILSHRTLEIPDHTLLNNLPDDVNLNINLVALLLRGSHDALLGIRNQHDLEPALVIIHGRDRQTGAVERNIPFLDDIPKHAPLARRKPERQRIAVGGDAQHARHRVDVALHEVAAHARRRADGPLQVHFAARRQRAQVRPP